MSDKIWQPTALEIAQLTTVTVGGTLSGETFTISVNGIDIASHTDSDTSIASAVAALVSAWNASTHSYATGITAADASPDITLTADNAGEPFAVTLNTPGGSATFAQAETTSATGPNHIDNADNWGGSLPSNDDDLYFSDSSIDALWGLDQLSTTGHTMHVEQTYTGKIGLASATFLLAGAADETAPEYRADYLELDILRLEVGGHVGPGNPSGSTRLKIDNTRSSASTTVVHNTAGSAQETGKPAVRLKTAHASADIHVRGGSGGVGIAMDSPGETSTCGDISVTGSKSRVYIGEGVTLTNFTQAGGNNLMQAAATVTSVAVDGGALVLEGDYTITTLTVDDGLVIDNHLKTSGNAITTAALNGGTLDLSKSSEARTIGTLNPAPGATLMADSDVVTITTLNDPAGDYTISWS